MNLLDDGGNKPVNGVVRAGAREWLSVYIRVLGRADWKGGIWTEAWKNQGANPVEIWEKGELGTGLVSHWNEFDFSFE